MLASSGLGEMYEAHDELLNRSIALKTIRADTADRADLDRLYREARAFARLQHPNIVTIFDAGEAAGFVYVAMEYLIGEDLSAALGRDALSPRTKIEIVMQILEALRYAHGQGVLHRSIKPTNVFRLEDGSIKLLEFGFTRAASHHSLTDVGAMMQSPAYASPEELRGERVDGRADIYSVGALAYELMTGRRAFEGDNPSAVIFKVLSEPPPPMNTSWTDRLPEIERVILRAMAKQPEGRYATAGDMRDALAGALAGEGVPLRPGAGRPPARDAGEPLTRHAALVENAQFTAYRPRAITANVWYPFLVFAHPAERSEKAHQDEPDPLEEVARQARQVLGDRFERFSPLTEDSRQPIPRAGEIVFVPALDGIEFNPPSRSFQWLEPVHREEFRMRASSGLAGQTARGRLTVYLGSLIVAEVSLAVRVESRDTGPTREVEAERSRPYRRIFASYSHKDRVIVEQCERFAHALGDRYLRDVTTLRAGQVWVDGIERMIGDADLFQLFWSANAMRSSLVRREWEFALALNRSDFIRPTYWEEPLPADPVRDLPPESLRRLHFQRLATDLPGATRVEPPPADAAWPIPTAEADTATFSRDRIVQSSPATTLSRTVPSRELNDWPSTAARQAEPVPGSPRRLAVISGAVASIVGVIAIVVFSLPARRPTSQPEPTTRPESASQLEQSTVDRLLIDYGSALGNFDLEALRRIYPGVPASAVDRMEAQRDDFTHCEYRFLNTRILSSSETEADVTADSLESCTPSTRDTPVEIRGRQRFHFMRSSSGPWIVGEVSDTQ